MSISARARRLHGTGQCLWAAQGWLRRCQCHRTQGGQGQPASSGSHTAERSQYKGGYQGHPRWHWFV